MAVQLNLNNIWEWNPISGDPFIPPADSRNSRYCPTIDEMDPLVNARLAVGNYLKERVFTFMTSNETRFLTLFDAHKSNPIHGYLRLIRSLQLKKIRVEYVAGGSVISAHGETSVWHTLQWRTSWWWWRAQNSDSGTKSYFRWDLLSFFPT